MCLLFKMNNEWMGNYKIKFYEEQMKKVSMIFGKKKKREDQIRDEKVKCCLKEVRTIKNLKLSEVKIF